MRAIKQKAITSYYANANVSSNLDYMRFKLTIITILFSQVVRSQNLGDTVYFKNFETFIRSTETLIKESQKQKNSKPDSINFYANEVKNILRKLDSIDRFSFSMANYFEDGKRTRSRDISSPVAQLQCSYSHYMQNLRHARDSIPAIVKASLILESHLMNGFPPSLYCPFIYDEVKFGPGLAPAKPPVNKIVLPDSLRKEN